MVKRILITDDDKKLVKRYKKILEKAGYETDCAYNGQESLEKLKEGKVDLLILDLQMPVMSGDKVLNIIRADESLKKTKVLVTSSFAYTEELV